MSKVVSSIGCSVAVLVARLREKRLVGVGGIVTDDEYEEVEEEAEDDEGAMEPI